MCLYSQINHINILRVMDLTANRVLSASAIILGLYIIATYFWTRDSTTKQKVFSTKTRQNYHIGCYLNDHNLSHYNRLNFRIDELKTQALKKTAKETSLIPNDYIEKKGVEVAQNFQKFIEQYNIIRARTRSNIELSKAVSKAKLQFQICLDDLNSQSSFSEKDCIQNWQSYKKCSSELDILKGNLNAQFIQKDKITLKLKGLLDKNTGPILVSHAPNDFQKQFKRRYRQFQDEQKRLDTELKLLNEKITQSEYQLLILVNNTNHAHQLYSECNQNRMQFRLCQELTKEVRILGHGSIQNLQQKVKRKTSILLKINQTIKQDPSSSQLRELFQKSFADYKKLLKLFVQTKAKMKRHCGCSESDQIRLKADMQKCRLEQQGKKRQISDNKQKYRKKLQQINNIRLQMKSLLDQFESKLHKLSSSQKNQIKPDLSQLLTKIQRERKTNQIGIEDLQNKFKELEYNCKKIKDRLTFNVKGVSQINDCLNKFYYYSQIKKKYQKQVPKQIKMDEILTRKLYKSVQQFKF